MVWRSASACVEERAEPRFVEEELHVARITGELGADPLQRDALGEPRDARVLGQIDLAHPAGGERADQQIAAEPVHLLRNH
jgi:hypothetical protein